MATLWSVNILNLCRFHIVFRRKYAIYSTSFLNSRFLNQLVHFKERYIDTVERADMPSYVLASSSNNIVIRSFSKNAKKKQTKEYRINNAIKAKHVRLIDQDGKNLGIITLDEALEKGRKANCMVVEVVEPSSETESAVCKLISQKQLYERVKEQKKKSIKTSKMKEIKLTGKISEHDLNIKLKKMIEFLEVRDNVKVFVVHRRRQGTSVDDKKALIKKIAEQTASVGCLQGEIKVVGNGLRAIFVPIQQK